MTAWPRTWRRCPASSLTASGYAPVGGGLRLYFERQGSGRPLLLLHGGYGATESFDALAPHLAGGRELIAVDLQGHGRTADVDRPLRFETLADDIAALLAYLQLDRVDLLGYSLGGGRRDGSWDRSGVSSARLAVLPGVTHYDILAWPLLPALVTAFLDETG